MNSKNTIIKRLYHHKTDGGAEYLCSNNVKGTNEGSFDSKYVVRIYDKKYAELIITDKKEGVK